MAAAAVLAIAIAAGAFFAGRESASSSQRGAAPASAAPPAQRKVLYWHDPMVPGPRFDKPGKSPFMDMALVPVYADEAAGAGVTVSAAVQQNLGIRTATVRKTRIASSTDAVGTVQFDERLNVAVQTRVAGYVEHLAVRATMERVRKGQALATVYAPDWLGPIGELVALERAGASPDLVEAARQRTLALSIPPQLVRESERAGHALARFTLVAPVSGVVAELGVREGVQVAPGMTLFRIAGLEKVWAVAEIPEAQAVHLARGQAVNAALQADASQSFAGRLEEILPEINASTRTLKARFEVDNRAGRLTPGMLLRINVAGPAVERLVVPAESVIRTGTRAVAIVRGTQGHFEPREVRLGADFGDQLEVTEGLREGDAVVASGQFLVDSEARLRSVLDAMAAAPAASAPATPALYNGTGKVESVDADSITISHGPIAELKWPGMTMGFGKADAKAFADVKPGDTVHFQFMKGGDLGWQLVAVQRMEPAK
ncbi:MAG TPA: efflux RND transporter periplasmic adaptor subunit [Ramlibacter sp.]